MVTESAKMMAKLSTWSVDHWCVASLRLNRLSTPLPRSQ